MPIRTTSLAVIAWFIMPIATSKLATQLKKSEEQSVKRVAQFCKRGWGEEGPSMQACTESVYVKHYQFSPKYPHTCDNQRHASKLYGCTAQYRRVRGGVRGRACFNERTVTSTNTDSCCMRQFPNSFKHHVCTHLMQLAAGRWTCSCAAYHTKGNQTHKDSPPKMSGVV